MLSVNNAASLFGCARLCLLSSKLAFGWLFARLLAFREESRRLPAPPCHLPRTLYAVPAFAACLPFYLARAGRQS